ncbi:hypothetical protein CEXT_130421 [Caerostris extrusa]|uniref:Uncharacterized protein n=1 Tax=Caerostris extrusa TaxID=172846 RepID=A0AAV4N399_CAEEX|nr:hypothetical protein CEXT_130421 [Caerostris extrusa]
MTQAPQHIGKGYSAIEILCMIMNMSAFSTSTFQSCTNAMNKGYKISTASLQFVVHSKIKKFCNLLHATPRSVVYIAVSFDVNDSDFHLDERIWHSSQNEATFSKGHQGEKMPEDVEQSLVSESGY